MCPSTVLLRQTSVNFLVVSSFDFGLIHDLDVVQFDPRHGTTTDDTNGDPHVKTTHQLDQGCRWIQDEDRMSGMQELVGRPRVQKAHRV